MVDIAPSLRRHWFYLLLPVWIGLSLGFRSLHPWGEQPGLGESTTLIDWCVFVPALHVICYRDLPTRTLVLRTLAMLCGGIWVAGVIVPDAAMSILRDWGWIRGIGLVVLALFECVALVAMLRVVFGGTPDAAALARQGIPLPIARLMLAEARFWRWIWMRLRGR